jgi:hypothetical protein
MPNEVAETIGGMIHQDNETNSKAAVRHTVDLRARRKAERWQTSFAIVFSIGAGSDSWTFAEMSYSILSSEWSDSATGKHSGVQMRKEMSCPLSRKIPKQQ